MFLLHTEKNIGKKWQLQSYRKHKHAIKSIITLFHVPLCE